MTRIQCVCAAVLAAGFAPHKVMAEDAPAAAATDDAKKPHHASNLKGWETNGEKPKSGDPLTTASLAKEMHEALASVVLATKSSTTAKFDQKSKEEKPFWEGIKGADTSLGAMEKALAAKDQKGYLTSESDMGRSISQVNVSWKLLGKKDASIDKGLVALNRSYRIFDEHYGAEAARRKTGGDLTDAEKANLEKLRTQQAELTKKLKDLKAAAAKEKNKIASEMVADIERKSNRIAKSKGDTVDNYTHECTLVAEESAELAAYNTILVDYYPKSEFYTTGWVTLDSDRAAVSSYYVDFESTEFTIDLEYTSESVTEYGDFYDVSVDVSSEDIASSESYSESYSEESATEEVADEETSVEADESEDVEAEDADSSGEDSLDDEGDSEEMEADDEPDDGDSADDGDSSDDDSSIAEPSRIIMLAETHADMLNRCWPVAGTVG